MPYVLFFLVQAKYIVLDVATVKSSARHRKLLEYAERHYGLTELSVLFRIWKTPRPRMQVLGSVSRPYHRRFRKFRCSRISLIERLRISWAQRWTKPLPFSPITTDGCRPRWKTEEDCWRCCETILWHRGNCSNRLKAL